MLELPKTDISKNYDPLVEENIPTPLQGPAAKNLFRSSLPRWSENLGFRGGGAPVRSPFKIVLWSWVAASIDALILLSLSSLFLLSFALIMRFGLDYLLVKQFGGSGVLKLYAGVFIVASWLYLITTRAFLGCSLGEKVCNLRLGTPLDRISNLYVLRVFVRNTLILVTGVITFPLLSIVTKHDLAGKLTGLSLFSIK